MYYDKTYILILIATIIALLASSNVKRIYKKYSKINSLSNISAFEAARQILNAYNLTDVRIERVSGDLTDHYSPKEKILRLSDTTYNSKSIAAIGVAAHECGHAIQHSKNYIPIIIRNKIVPIVNFGTKLAWPMILLGVLFGYIFIEIGIIFFSFSLIFQIITLPVEFNASKRALKILQEDNFLNNEEIKKTKKVLNAAAMTYVVAVVSSILSLLRIIILYGGKRND